MVASFGARLEAGGAAAMPIEKSRQANKAYNHGLSGMVTLQQM